MQIELSEEMEGFVRDQIGSGRYPDETSVIDAALRIMRDRSEKRAAVRRAILEGETIEPAALRF